MKKLYRSDKNKVFAGIIGGVGEYFNVDPNILRLLCLVIFALSGFVPGIIAYIFAVHIIPKRLE